MTLPRWQRICAWAAVGAGAIWTAKFFLLLAVDGHAGGLQPFTGFFLPTSGSGLGFLAAFGIAAPLVRRRPFPVALPAMLVVGVPAIVVVAALSGSAQGALSGSANGVLRTETSALVSGVLWLLFATWMFLTRQHAEQRS